MSNMAVQTNVMAINSHRSLGLVGNAQNRASARLSSGFRINSAADDAAGLAISEKMRAQIRGLDQASRNGQDGISLIQTAEGAMSIVNDMVIRIRELVVQASNDTNAHDGGNLAQSDRIQIQREINALMDEIDDITLRTEFNTRTLLDGTLGVESIGTARPAPVAPAPGGPVVPGTSISGSALAGLSIITDAMGMQLENNEALFDRLADLFDHDLLSGGNTLSGAVLSMLYSTIATGGLAPVGLAEGYEFIGAYAFEDADGVAFGYSVIAERLNAAIAMAVGFDGGTHGEFQEAVVAWLDDHGILNPVAGDYHLVDLASLFDTQYDTTQAGLDSIAAARTEILNAIQNVDISDIVSNGATELNLFDHWSFFTQVAGGGDPGNVFGINNTTASRALFTDWEAAEAAAHAALANFITETVGGNAAGTGNIHSHAMDLLDWAQDPGNGLFNFLPEFTTLHGLVDLLNAPTGMAQFAMVADTTAGTGINAPGAGVGSMWGPGGSGQVRIVFDTDNVFTLDLDYEISMFSPAGDQTTFDAMTFIEQTIRHALHTHIQETGLDASMIDSQFAGMAILGSVTLIQTDDTSMAAREVVFDIRSGVDAGWANADHTWTTVPTFVLDVRPGYGAAVVSTDIELTTVGESFWADLQAAVAGALNPFLVDGGTAAGPGAPPPSTPGAPPTQDRGNALWFHIGANSNQGVHLNIEAVNVATLSAVGEGRTALTVSEETQRHVALGRTFANLRNRDLDDGMGVMLAMGEDINQFIDSIDAALAHVAGQRANLGATQNRLEFTIENLDIASENLNAANSRIRDADMAQEMMRFTQSNVLQQAAISMLAQANQAPQSILQLLR